MKLIESRVKKFRNYVDSGELRVEDSITSLIGKNESGKTAFIKALYSIKPDNTNEVQLNVDIDYPRWFKVRDARIQKSEGESLENVPFVEATFSLDIDDINHLSELLGIPISQDAQLSIERYYSGELTAKLVSSEEKLLTSLFESDKLSDNVKNLLNDSIKHEDIIKKLNDAKSIKSEKINKLNDLITHKNNILIEINLERDIKIEELSNLQLDNGLDGNEATTVEESSEDISDSHRIDEIHEEINILDNRINKINEEVNQFNEEIGIINEEIVELNIAITAFDTIQDTLEYLLADEFIESIYEILPTFFYYGSYNTLKGRIDLDVLIHKKESEIDKYDKTVLALLKLVGVSGQELMDENYEIRKAELEAAASEVTRQVLDYWTQNQDLFCRSGY